MNVVLSDKAREDIESTLDFLKHQSPKAASSFRESLKSQLESLSQFPFIGHRRPDLTAYDVLFLSFQRHLLVYQVDDPFVRIIRCLSGYQDLYSHLNPS
jgi:plasmid stabilization system protein ParE